MTEIKNAFVVTMADGSVREYEAGRIEVGSAGQLNIKDISWTFWNTFESVREVIAPGIWVGWARQARDPGVNDE